MRLEFFNVFCSFFQLGGSHFFGGGGAGTADSSPLNTYTLNTKWFGLNATWVSEFCSFFQLLCFQWFYYRRIKKGESRGKIDCFCSIFLLTLWEWNCSIFLLQLFNEWLEVLRDTTAQQSTIKLGQLRDSTAQQRTTKLRQLALATA